MFPISNFPQPSLRLKNIGFSYDPFAWQQAEKMDLDVLEEIYTAHPKFEETILNFNQSSILLASYGGGKTAGRLRLTTVLMRQQENEAKKYTLHSEDSPSIPLIVQYNDFEHVTSMMSNVSVEHHTSFLLAGIAESILNFVIAYPKIYEKLSSQDRDFWWTFINKYKLGASVGYILTNSLLLTDWKRNIYKESPINNGTSLATVLRIVVERLNSLMIKTLFILVDGVDAQIRNDKSRNDIPLSLLNHLGLFSIRGVIWKFFLPSELEDAIRKSNSVQTNRLEIVSIKWDTTSLSKFLSDRLDWGSEGKISKITPQCSQDLITKLGDVDVDTMIAEMALKYFQFGPPQALLVLASRLYHLGTHFQITVEDWDKFTAEIQSEPHYIQGIYQSMILRVLDDRGRGVGTAFATRHQSRNLIVTCAHVIKTLGKKENDELRINHLESNTEFLGKIIWLRCPEDRDMGDWSAIEDVCIIESAFTLKENETLPLATESNKEKYEGHSDCYCFGYLLGTGSRGAWFTKISTKKHERPGGGFIGLLQVGNERIGRGVSGSPLYSPISSGIIGIIQSIRGLEDAYLIPVDVIQKTLESIVHSNQEE